MVKRIFFLAVTFAFIGSIFYVTVFSTKSSPKSPKVEETANSAKITSKKRDVNISPEATKYPGWKLSWSDEFTGDKINQTYWTLQEGGDIWGNNEMQYYKASLENCYISDGKLIIKAMKERVQEHQYTSARITTKGKLDFLYGKVDIKAKLPAVKGLLAALWMIPSQDIYPNRMKNGEIDLMEALGENPKKVYCGVFYYTDKLRKFGGKYLRGDKDFSDGFHLFSLEWTSKEMRWLVDNKMYYRVDLKKKFSPAYNPFREKFFLVMNVAVGGEWPGFLIDGHKLPASMEIDYVRYYIKSDS